MIGHFILIVFFFVFFLLLVVIWLAVFIRRSSFFIPFPVAISRCRFILFLFVLFVD